MRLEHIFAGFTGFSIEFDQACGSSSNSTAGWSGDVLRAPGRRRGHQG